MYLKSDVENERIDVYLSKKLDISRSRIAKMLDKCIKVNGSSVKSSYKLSLDDEINIDEYEEDNSIKPVKMDLDIIYEDDYLMVINKQNGLVVHPGNGNKNNTLVNALMYHSNKLSDLNGEFRPGIVHRIDAYTTGLLMIAKDNKTHEFLSLELQNKKTYRKYIALVWGVINHETGEIDAPIGRDLSDRKKMAVTSINSKRAITHFKVLERYKEATLIELVLETGRTHQIRVHMDYINHPVVNDPVYGKRKLINDDGQCLHAKELGFTHPKTLEFMKFSVEPPSCFTDIVNKFKEDL